MGGQKAKGGMPTLYPAAGKTFSFPRHAPTAAVLGVTSPVLAKLNQPSKEMEDSPLC